MSESDDSAISIKELTKIKLGNCYYHVFEIEESPGSTEQDAG